MSRSRFQDRAVYHRTPGPAVGAPDDGLEGCYSAVIQKAPTGGGTTCQVVVNTLDGQRYATAFISGGFTVSVGDVVLVAFDEFKRAWVTSPTGTSASKINGATVPLTGSAWTAPTLINSWANVGGGNETAGYLKDPLGFVHLKGAVIGGVTGSVAFGLPAGFRPGAGANYSVFAGSSVVALAEISSAGNVVLFFSGVSTQIGLSGVTFLAEN